MKHEDHIVMGIYEAFEALGNAFPAAEMDAVDLGGFLRSIEPLTDAVKRAEWVLIAEAAQMRADEPRVELQVDILARKVAWMIYRNPEEHGLEGRPTKADILDVLETRFPYFFERLPTSKRALTDWWKKVGCGAKQSRGHGRRASNNP
jgi:hypothetical protein